MQQIPWCEAIEHTNAKHAVFRLMKLDLHGDLTFGGPLSQEELHAGFPPQCTKHPLGTQRGTFCIFQADPKGSHMCTSSGC
jgi:hypothetical protein